MHLPGREPCALSTQRPLSPPFILDPRGDSSNDLDYLALDGLIHLLSDELHRYSTHIGLDKNVTQLLRIAAQAINRVDDEGVNFASLDGVEKFVQPLAFQVRASVNILVDVALIHGVAVRFPVGATLRFLSFE